MATFMSKLRNANKDRRWLVQGLDPVEDRIPTCVSKQTYRSLELRLQDFLLPIIDATAPYVAGFKPNLSFFLAFDDVEVRDFDGQEALVAICQHIKENYPDHLIILDAKDGDIGASNNGYCQRAFDGYEVDAVTWNPYLGTAISEQLKRYPQKGFIALARTSNPEGTALQNLELKDGRKVFEAVVDSWMEKQNASQQIGFVARATHPEELRAIRKRVGAAPLLIPGVGTQGGNAAEVAKAGFGGKYGNMLINVSSGSLYASSGDNFAKAAASYMQRTAAEINIAVPKK